MSEALELLARIDTMIAQEEAELRVKRQLADGNNEALIVAAEEFHHRVRPLRAERDALVKRLADLKAFEPLTVIIPSPPPLPKEP